MNKYWVTDDTSHAIIELFGISVKISKMVK